MLVFWRLDPRPALREKSAQPVTQEAMVTKQLIATRAGLARTLPADAQSTLTTDSGWKTILANLATLLTRENMEVCGLTGLDALLFVAGDVEVGTQAVNTTLTQVAGKFAESRKLSEQALGLYMQAHLDEWARSHAEHAKYRICDGDFVCLISGLASTERVEVLPEIKAAATAPLIKLAQANRDPATVAAAIYACGGNRANACALIGIEDWAAVDADNAAVWLMVADAALFRKDLAGREQALRRAAEATAYDLRVPPLFLAADSALVNSQSLLTQSHISNQLASFHITTLLPPTYAYGSHCIHDKNTDKSRTLCNTLTERLVQKDESLLGLSMAILAGKKLGWDETRLEQLRNEKSVVYGLLLDGFPTAGAFSCPTLAKNNQVARNALSHSERANARTLVANSGKSLADLAEAYRIKYPDSRK